MKTKLKNLMELYGRLGLAVYLVLCLVTFGAAQLARRSFVSSQAANETCQSASLQLSVRGKSSTRHARSQPQAMTAVKVARRRSACPQMKMW